MNEQPHDALRLFALIYGQNLEPGLPVRVSRHHNLATMLTGVFHVESVAIKDLRHRPEVTIKSDADHHAYSGFDPSDLMPAVIHSRTRSETVN